MQKRLLLMGACIVFGFSLLALAVLAALPRRQWRAGQAGLLSLGLVATIAFAVSSVRGDEMPLIQTWRLDALAYGLLLIVTLLAAVGVWATQAPPD